MFVFLLSNRRCDRLWLLAGSGGSPSRPLPNQEQRLLIWEGKRRGKAGGVRSMAAQTEWRPQWSNWWNDRKTQFLRRISRICRGLHICGWLYSSIEKSGKKVSKGCAPATSDMIVRLVWDEYQCVPSGVRTGRTLLQEFWSPFARGWGAKRSCHSDRPAAAPARELARMGGGADRAKARKAEEKKH